MSAQPPITAKTLAKAQAGNQEARDAIKQNPESAMQTLALIGKEATPASVKAAARAVSPVKVGGSVPAPDVPIMIESSSLQR